MDYKTIMEDSEVSFNDVYEKAIDKLFSDLDVPMDTIEKLKEKRKKGLDKYGEFSFQSNFNNAIASPVLEHAMEEIQDAMNYIAHKIFVYNLQFNENKCCYEDLLSSLIDIYETMASYKENEDDK